jgi:hypothetical protein
MSCDVRCGSSRVWWLCVPAIQQAESSIECHHCGCRYLDDDTQRDKSRSPTRAVSRGELRTLMPRLFVQNTGMSPGSTEQTSVMPHAPAVPLVFSSVRPVSCSPQPGLYFMR